jgi:putative ATP-dependent endonuclease of OLD family
MLRGATRGAGADGMNTTENRIGGCWTSDARKLLCQNLAPSIGLWTFNPVHFGYDVAIVMHLAQLTIENFRIFGSRAEKTHLELRITKGLTVLVGENDSGKTAIVDALRLVLGTTSQDFLRVNEDDFHKAGGNTAMDFSIYCRFENLTEEEAARFLEWLSFEDKQPVLELTLRAFRVSRKNRSGVDVSVIEVTNRSGPDGQGKALDGDVRSFLRLTYLKPLRDAESEMSAGKGSRLSQLLLYHPKLSGQDKPSDLPVPVAGEPPKPPPTLRGIMATAETWIKESPAIIGAKEQLNKDYLSNLSIGSEKLSGQITIGRSADLKGILEKLELWLTADAAMLDRTRHGLGFNNLLFMAAELLLLSESAETGLPLLLIEEPEAHLHPQLQLRLMEFLEEKTKGQASVQVVVSTHSPNLSSKADIENVTHVAKGRAYPLASTHTKLTPGDYRFLRRFLDTTKANLFFARGVVLAEGDAENILLPALAKLLGRSFTEYGISVVNVGSRGLFRYARIFQRTDTQEPPVKVACISDRDIPPDEAKDYAPKTKKQTDENLPKYESEMQAAGKIPAHMESLKKYDGGVVKTFVSERWTLEHDLALSGLGLELHKAVSFAKKLKNTDRAFPDVERNEIFTAAVAEYAQLGHGVSAAILAARVYQPLFDEDASKAVTAQVLAEILEMQKPTPDQLRQKLPPYLIAAIEYVTAQLPPLPPLPANANGN